MKVEKDDDNEYMSPHMREVMEEFYIRQIISYRISIIDDIIDEEK